MSDFPEGVFPTEGIEPIQPLGSDQKKLVSSTPFQTFMQPTSTESPMTNAPSPFDLSHVKGQVIAGKPTVDSILAQVQSTQGAITDAQTHLNTPNLKLNRAQKYLISNKLTDAKAHINSTADKIGIDPLSTKETPAGTNPIVKFLAILTDGQQQLESAKQGLFQLQKQGTAINPAELLLMQIKLGKAQHEIEYASVLLAKAVDSMKQFFNIQI